MKISFTIKFDDEQEHSSFCFVEKGVSSTMVGRVVRALLRDTLWTLQLAGYLTDRELHEMFGYAENPCPKEYLEAQRVKRGITNYFPVP
jgi:hypothetical protein